MAFEMNNHKIKEKVNEAKVHGTSDVLEAAAREACSSINKIKDEATEKLENLQKSFQSTTETVKNFAEKHPFYFAATSAIVGFLAGSLASANRSTSSKE